MIQCLFNIVSLYKTKSLTVEICFFLYSLINYLDKNFIKYKLDLFINVVLLVI
jgi:hypothetical protein